jgi:ABC-2 type transport system ATP-binding protein
MEPSLELVGVTKTYGSKLAVSGLDLSVASGTLCGLIGPNGAGKTTTIRMIMSIVMPDAGAVRILGRRSAADARDRIGYLPEERGVYPKMTVEEYLVYIARLKGLSLQEATLRARRQLERMELGHALHQRIEELSKGMVQKVQFLAAVLHEPDLLILDEPFSGLDPVSMRFVRELILEHRSRGAAVLFSTHVMTFAEELCDNVVMIAHGRKVLDSPMAALRHRLEDIFLALASAAPDSPASRPERPVGVLS